MQCHAPTKSQVGIAQNRLTNHELVSMHINVKVLGNSVCTNRLERCYSHVKRHKNWKHKMLSMISLVTICKYCI